MSTQRAQRLRGVSVAAATAMVMVMVMATLTGCSAKHDKTSGPPTTATSAAWQAVLGQIQPDGTVSLATALAAFAVAVAPVPGGDPPAGTKGPIESGTLAISWVFAHWAELDDAQRAAVRTALGQLPSADHTANLVVPGRVRAAPAPSASPSPNPNIACLTADSAGAAKYRAWMPGIQADIAAHLGRPLSIAANTFLSVNTKNLEQPSLMYTWACGTTGDKVSGCTIHINPNTIGGTFTDDMVRSYLIHEVTHCFLYDKFGLPYDAMPAWYVEGVPTWTMSVLGVANDRLSSKWVSYLDSPGRPLPQRAYDAVGFFAHLAETGTDPWTVIDPIGAAMVTNHATAAGWQAAGVTNTFLESWGPGFVQGRHPGKSWNSTGPNLPPYTPALPNGRFGNGSSVSVGSPAFGAAVERVDVDAQVVVVTAGAGTAGLLTLDGSSDSSVTAGGPLCTIDGCQCPQGSPGAGTRFTHMTTGQQYLGVSGGSAKASVVLTGMTLEDYCKKPPAPCVVGQWTGVNFDVHLDNATEQGGAGVSLHIDPKGNLMVDFGGMQPVTFQFNTGGSDFAGSFVYTGRVTGVINLPPAGATSGNWNYATPADISGLTAVVHLSSPVALDLPPLPLANLGAAGGAGAAIPSNPMVTGGWQCSGDTMTTTPPPGSPVTGTWALRRTGPG